MDTSNDHIDPHVVSYDCTGAVSLNSSMQSNVPSPFGGMHKFTHLNMPGGQWEQSSKWMSHDLNSSHYMNLRRETRKNWTANGGQTTPIIDPNEKGSKMHGSMSTTIWFASKTPKLSANAYCASQIHRKFYTNSLFNRMNAITNHDMLLTKRHLSANSNEAKEVTKSKSTASTNDATSIDQNTVPLSAREKLKKAVKDYGITVMLFHVTISLASLGFFYQIVARYVSKIILVPGSHFVIYENKKFHRFKFISFTGMYSSCSRRKHLLQLAIQYLSITKSEFKRI